MLWTFTFVTKIYPIRLILIIFKKKLDLSFDGLYGKPLTLAMSSIHLV